MANTNAAGIQQVFDGNDSGIYVGSAATDLLGFYGKTPIVRPTGSTAVSTSAPVAASGFGAVTSAQWIALVTAVNLHRDVLRTLGLSTSV